MTEVINEETSQTFSETFLSRKKKKAKAHQLFFIDGKDFSKELFLIDIFYNLHLLAQDFIHFFLSVEIAIFLTFFVCVFNNILLSIIIFCLGSIGLLILGSCSDLVSLRACDGPPGLIESRESLSRYNADIIQVLFHFSSVSSNFAGLVCRF